MQDEIERLKSTTYFLTMPFFPMKMSCKHFPDSVQSQLSGFIYRKISAEKSLTTAALLSTLIPGAGKIYGEIGDGVTALITTALSAYLAYTNFKTDHQFRAVVHWSNRIFYGGSIYGSATSAQIYNIRFNFNNEVKLYFEKNYFLPRVDF